MPLNSNFANIYLAIMARIKAEVPEIVFIEHDLGQLEDYSGGKPAVAFPCALIDFDQWQFENMGSAAQVAQGDVIIKIGFAQHGQTNSETPDAWREAALNYYDIEYKLNKNLHGWSPLAEVGYLTRTSETKENRPLGVRVKFLRYRLEFEDYSASPEVNTMDTPPLEVTN